MEAVLAKESAPLCRFDVGGCQPVGNELFSEPLLVLENGGDSKSERSTRRNKKQWRITEEGGKRRKEAIGESQPDREYVCDSDNFLLVGWGLDAKNDMQMIVFLFMQGREGQQGHGTT